MTTIHLTNVTSAPSADALKQAIDGQTYMDFKVRVCPAYGSFAVNVETDYTDDANEVKDFLIGFLASKIR